jgi:hypothetical protein
LKERARETERNNTPRDSFDDDDDVLLVVLFKVLQRVREEQQSEAFKKEWKKKD